MEKKLFRSILWIITYAVLLVLFILRFDEVRNWVSTLLGVLRPLFIGFAIAFILHLPTQFFYGHYRRALQKAGGERLARPLAVGSSYLVLALLLFAFFSVLLPQLTKSIQLFVSSMGDYARNAQVWLNWLLSKLNLEIPNLSSISDLIKSALTAVGNTITTAVPQLVAFTGSLISIVVTAFLSIIFSVYFLSGREKLLSQCRRVLRAYVPKRLADVVSLNFNNAAGKLGANSVASANAEQTAEKLRWVQEGAGDRFDELELEIGAYFVAVTDDRAAAAEALAGRFGVTGDEIVSHPHAFIGSVDQICDTLEARRAATGISYITVSQRNVDDFAPVVERLSGR